MSHGRNDSPLTGTSAGVETGSATSGKAVCETAGPAGTACGGRVVAADAGCDGVGCAAVTVCVDAGRLVVGRWVACRCGGLTVVAGSRPAADGGGAAVAGAGAGVAGWVLVPGKLKPCSSRGPIASVAGALVVAGAVVSCANADVAESISPPVSNIVLKRKPALISSRSVLGRRSVAARTVHARVDLPIQAQLR